MILNDPCFKKKIPTPPPNRESRDGSPIFTKDTRMKTYFLINCFNYAVVIAESSERVKRMMTESTLYDWGEAEDIELIFTGKEQILLEGI